MAELEKRKPGLWWSPWVMKQAQLDSEFMKVTPSNIQSAKCIGRIFYIISHSRHKEYIYEGSFSIDPLRLKGKWEWPMMPFLPKPKEYAKKTTFRVTFDTDQSRDEWAAYYKKTIDKYLESGTLYIKPSDPILTYIKE